MQDQATTPEPITPGVIVEMRKFRRWSQGDLGDMLGVTQTAVSRLENDQTQIGGPILKLLEPIVAEFRRDRDAGSAQPSELAAAK